MYTEMFNVSDLCMQPLQLENKAVDGEQLEAGMKMVSTEVLKLGVTIHSNPPYIYLLSSHK